MWICVCDMSKLGQQFCPKVTGSFSRYFRNPHICKRKTKEREEHHGERKGGKKRSRCISKRDPSVTVKVTLLLNAYEVYKTPEGIGLQTLLYHELKRRSRKRNM